MKKIILASIFAVCAWSVHAETFATIETNMGNIRVQLDEHRAPKTVANFIKYANDHFYNNTIFHRVIDGFMIQGGGMTANLIPKATREPIANEADNGLKNTVGTIAMARTSDPNSANSQFFINTANNPFLDFTAKTMQGYGYAVFGKVVNGMDVVNKISHVRTTSRYGNQNVPVEPIIIKDVKISH